MSELAKRLREKCRYLSDHDCGEMAAAAAGYAYNASLPDDARESRITSEEGGMAVPPGCVRLTDFMFPRLWRAEWWKPKDRRRDLVRAGALILAEIERLDRASQKVGYE